jgi:type II secretory ATPase GspE/PulE/Tfp pilus assembly ATPase PilB-like protein
MFDLGMAHRGAGCDDCSGSGYLGRVGYYELLLSNSRLRELISRGAGAEELSRAVNESHTTMRIDGLIKAAEGQTTIEEVLRATQDTEDNGH